MARIRTIKPDFWTDEKIVKLSPLARLLFIGLWNFADDYGRMKYSPVTIKLQILPLESTNCSAELGELRREKMVTVYEVDGTEYLQIVNFDEHQKVDKRSQPKFPEPPPNPAESRRVPPLEGNGKGKEDNPPNPLGKFELKNRLSPDLPADWKAECVAEMGWRPDVVDDVWLKFYRFQSRQLGLKGVATLQEWKAEWRTWYRQTNIKPERQAQQAVARKPLPGVATL